MAHSYIHETDGISIKMYDNIPKEVTNIVVTGKSGAGKQPRIDVLVDEFDLQQLSTGNIFRTYLGKFNEYDFEGDLSQFWADEEECFLPDKEISKKLDTEDPGVILGMKAKYFVDRGLFVPDYITNELFRSYFGRRDFRKQVLDGYPRTLSQAKFLLDLLEEQNTDIDFILWVENEDQKIIERTIKRRICPDCNKVYHLEYAPPPEGKCGECDVEVIQRSDDTEEKIRSRLNEFKEKVVPAMEYMKEHGISIAKVPGHLEEFTPENVRRSVLEAVEEIYK